LVCCCNSCRSTLSTALKHWQRSSYTATSYKYYNVTSLYCARQGSC